MDDCLALILAAGRGTRLGAEIPKQYLALAGKPILRHAAEAFLGHQGVNRVRVVIRRDDRTRHDAALDGLAVLEPVIGGTTRQDSARLGLESVADAAPRVVLIHDAARPFPDAATIGRTLAALQDHPGALPAIPLGDTLKRARAGLVGATVERKDLWRAQTPQGFRYPEILAAHRAASGRALTDDAAVAEHAGLAVALVAGNEANIKVTTEEDLERARRWLGQGSGETRSGIGFDVHAFGPGAAVTLCGVEIAHDRALVGHSDADVAMHALCDAILGAIGQGDIGVHFSPTEAAWRDAASEIFLRRAAGLVAEQGGRIVNVDLTVICEAPRIGPHRAAMIARLADILGIEAARVSVKATTTEQLGFTGRGEGIAAQAVATVRLGG